MKVYFPKAQMMQYGQNFSKKKKRKKEENIECQT